MSNEASISIHVPKADTVDTFLELAERICHQAHGDPIVTEWTPNQHRDVCLDVASSGMTDLIGSTGDSERRVTIDLSYRAASGQIIPLEMTFNGAYFHHGNPWLLEGPIVLRFSMDDLEDPIRNCLKSGIGPEMTPEGYLGVYGPGYQQACGQVLADFEKISLRACGLAGIGPAQTRVQSAAMYREYGWHMPPLCSMVYHRHHEDFARDFARTFANYRWGVAATRMMAPNVNIWDLQSASLSRWEAPTKEWYEEVLAKPQTEWDHLDRLAFESLSMAESLDLDTAKCLSSLSGSFVRQRLLEMPRLASSDRYRDFEEAGGMLMGSIWTGLGGAYSWLRDACLLARQ